jgi:predicted membrane-bound spermidine synthase
MRKLKVLKGFSLGARLRVVAFAAGFSMMAYELVAARLLAPTIGNSTYTWTCVIGVIMAALSVGYFWGGRLADRRDKLVDVSFLGLAAALLVLVTLMANWSFTNFLAENVADQRVQGLLASLVLFAPVSVVLGMISPYLVKLASKSLETLGRTAAGLSTWNAIGSIAGTFVTGFVLFALIGSWQTLVMIALALVAVSWLIDWRTMRRARAGVTAGILLVVVCVWASFGESMTTVSIDTASANYQVQYQTVSGSSEKVVYLTSSPRGAQSAVFSGEPSRLLFWYTQEFSRIAAALPKLERVLVLGGGTFTVPRYLAEKYPEATVDVVEIDPELGRIAAEYFYFERPANLRMYFEDARALVNKAQEKYDLILVDVYNGVAIPWQFTTMEYTGKLAGILTDTGAVAINVVASEKGRCRPILEAIDAPYRERFSRRWLKTNESGKENGQNIILVYSNREVMVEGYREFGATGRAAFMDNFAPIEVLQLDCGL